MDKRVVTVDAIEQALEQIDQDYKSIFPVPLRGIITSIGEPVDLSWKSPASEDSMENPFFRARHEKAGLNKHPFVVKNIEDVLNNGTELEDTFSIRLALYDATDMLPIRPSEYADKSRIDFYVERAKADETVKERLRPALLVYDTTLLTPSSRHYEAELPRNPDARAKAILRAFVINS